MGKTDDGLLITTATMESYQVNTIRIDIMMTQCCIICSGLKISIRMKFLFNIKNKLFFINFQSLNYLIRFYTWRNIQSF